MEFKLITPKDMNFIQAITFNKAELMGEIKNRVAKYEGVKYGQEQIKEAKGDRATLNKFREAMEERRKEIKAWWNEPYMRFEKDVKEVLELIDKPIMEIDEQIKGYEEAKKRREKEGNQGDIQCEHRSV